MFVYGGIYVQWILAHTLSGDDSVSPWPHCKVLWRPSKYAYECRLCIFYSIDTSGIVYSINVLNSLYIDVSYENIISTGTTAMLTYYQRSYIGDPVGETFLYS